jgi:hypothetical protein
MKSSQLAEYMKPMALIAIQGVIISRQARLQTVPAIMLSGLGVINLRFGFNMTKERSNKLRPNVNVASTITAAGKYNTLTAVKATNKAIFDDLSVLGQFTVVITASRQWLA